MRYNGEWRNAQDYQWFKANRCAKYKRIYFFNELP